MVNTKAVHSCFKSKFLKEQPFWFIFYQKVALWYTGNVCHTAWLCSHHWYRLTGTNGFYAIHEKLWCVWFLCHSWKKLVCIVFIPFLKNWCAWFLFHSLKLLCVFFIPSCVYVFLNSIPEVLQCVWFLLHSWKSVGCMVISFLKFFWSVWFLIHSWKTGVYGFYSTRKNCCCCCFYSCCMDFIPFLKN